VTRTFFQLCIKKVEDQIWSVQNNNTLEKSGKPISGDEKSAVDFTKEHSMSHHNYRIMAENPVQLFVRLTVAELYVDYFSDRKKISNLIKKIRILKRHFFQFIFTLFWPLPIRRKGRLFRTNILFSLETRDQTTQRQRYQTSLIFSLILNQKTLNRENIIFKIFFLI